MEKPQSPETKKILFEIQGDELLDATLIAAAKGTSLTGLARLAITEFVNVHRTDGDVVGFVENVGARFLPTQPNDADSQP